MTKVTKKQINREKLIDQGVSMLMTQGYHGTGLQEILDEVQIPNGSFYNYFGSKEAFCSEVIQHYVDPLVKHVVDDLRGSEEKSLRVLNKHLKDLSAHYKKNQFEGGCLLGNLMGELGNNSEVIRSSLNLAVTKYRDAIKESLSMAQDNELIRKDLSAKYMADLLVNSWQGALLRMKVERSIAPLEACRKSLMDGYFKN
jgi:TetR/AcrR family transcriptional repressor of nem operon